MYGCFYLSSWVYQYDPTIGLRWATCVAVKAYNRMADNMITGKLLLKKV